MWLMYSRRVHTILGVVYMKTAIIGSRNLEVEIENYLPSNISLIVSGGARGIDTLAERYADKNGIPKQIFLPDYERYGKIAPLVRNRLIVDNSDSIIAFWDGVSRGTKFTIDYAKARGKEVIIYLI